MEAPAREYSPVEQTDAVELVDPAGQAYPATHDPLHEEAVRPEEEPYRPAEQGPEHNEVDRPGELPKRPAGQRLHNPEPAREYFPTGHTATVELVDPAGQAYPAAHGPVQAGEVRPVEEPYCPTGHLAEHAAVGRPGVLP